MMSSCLIAGRFSLKTPAHISQFFLMGLLLFFILLMTTKKSRYYGIEKGGCKPPCVLPPIGILILLPCYRQVRLGRRGTASRLLSQSHRSVGTGFTAIDKIVFLDCFFLLNPRAGKRALTSRTDCEWVFIQNKHLLSDFKYIPDTS